MTPLPRTLRGKRGVALGTLLAVAALVAGAWLLARDNLPRTVEPLRLSELGDTLHPGVTFEVAITQMPPPRSTAPLYRVVRTNMTEREAAALAERCGIRSGVSHIRGKWAGCKYVASQGDLALEVDSEPGCLRFTDLSLWSTYKEPVVMPQEGEAVRLAKTYLKKLGLLPGGDVLVSFVGICETRTHTTKEGKTVTEPYGWRVTFRRRLGGIEVRGKGGLSVDFAAHNEPAFLSRVWRPVEKGRDVPLIGVAAALHELRQGRAGCLWLDCPGEAMIESVTLLYWERPVVTRQTCFEPVYEFKGTFKPDDGSPEETFKAYVPAVASRTTGDSKGR